MFKAIKSIILFIMFAKATCLTCGHPVNLTNNWLEIVPEEKLDFLTTGAHLKIDVTQLTNKKVERDYQQKGFDFSRSLSIPITIDFILVFVDEERVFLSESFKNFGADSEGRKFVIFFPTRQGKRNFDQEDKKIDKMYIKSSRTIENTELIWNNTAW